MPTTKTTRTGPAMRITRKQLLISSGVSATKLAKQLGVTKSCVCRWFKDNEEVQRTPSIEHIIAMSRVLKISERELLRVFS